MSDEPLKQEEDRIATGKIVSIGVLALVCFAIGIAWASRIQRHAMGALRNGTGPRPAAVGQREIGMVYQPLFDSTDIARDQDAPKAARLATYGWLDDKKSVAHIPIKRAMELYVERSRK